MFYRYYKLLFLTHLQDLKVEPKREETATATFEVELPSAMRGFSNIYIISFPPTYDPNFSYGTMKQEHARMYLTFPDMYLELIYKALTYHMTTGNAQTLHEAAFNAYSQHHIPGITLYIGLLFIKSFPVYCRM